jgi:hypothetical protein
MAALVLFFVGYTIRAEEAVLEPGLVAEIFNMGEELQDFPTVAADKKATVKRVDKDVNVDSTEDAWPGTDVSEQFYIRWNGVIKIPKDGKYTFYCESDDGSRLFIDGKQAVDCGGLHGMEEKGGDAVELKAGNHDLKAEFFENGGGAGCKISWEGPDLQKQIIPASALFHKKGTEK